MRASPFSAAYAKYYDAFYSGKEYKHESQQLINLVHEHLESPKKILDLGSGTCRHAAEISDAGYLVTAVEREFSMIMRARRTVNLTLVVEDLRYLSLGERFDVVISLFHVFSYMTDTLSVNQFFETARSHLLPGGLLIFDFWNKEGVLSDLPTSRKSIYSIDGLTVIRESHPKLIRALDLVEVDYSISTYKVDECVEQSNEVHRLRYFSPHDVTDTARDFGFELLGVGDSIQSVSAQTGSSSSSLSWYKTLILRASQ